MSSKFLARLPYLSLVVITVCLDRWSKLLVQSRFSPNESIAVIDDFFNITYVRNTGVAFGIFSSIDSPLKAALLSLCTAIAATAVIIHGLRSPIQHRLLQLALALILAGALGNLYDRIAYGSVIDFLEFYFRSYHWPSFNVADSSITLGVVLLTIEIMRNENTTRS